MKKMNKKGFTLAELLIVVAIIAVLVAISIPVFKAQLEKSKEATDAANIRAAYAEVLAAEISGESGVTKTVSQKQDDAGWITNPEFPANLSVDDPTTKDSTWTVKLSATSDGYVEATK